MNVFSMALKTLGFFLVLVASVDNPNAYYVLIGSAMMWVAWYTKPTGKAEG